MQENLYFLTTRIRGLRKMVASLMLQWGLTMVLKYVK